VPCATAYGPLQNLIWQAETFGFHLVEMEFRQHSLVHSRALEDIREHGRWGERGELQPMTVEVLDTFRAIGTIQRINGVKAARRYIISFTKRPRTWPTCTSWRALPSRTSADVPRARRHPPVRAGGGPGERGRHAQPDHQA
jgi:phosphoenolpyruvate carboxylase